jgi:COP9 signalosome complex subunit 5
LQSNPSSIPRQKVQDYGVHCNDYYSLTVSIFKSNGNMRLLEALSKKYWIQALASEAHLSKKEVFSNQVTDFSEKIGEASISRGMSIESSEMDSNSDLRKECVRLDSECSHTLITQILKKYITHLP